jgi:hypothetical protein
MKDTSKFLMIDDAAEEKRGGRGDETVGCAKGEEAIEEFGDI